MKCPHCGKHVPLRRRRRKYRAGVAPNPLHPNSQSGPFLLNPGTELQARETLKMVACLGCGAVFTKDLQLNETCPICLKTFGWKTLGEFEREVT